MKMVLAVRIGGDGQPDGIGQIGAGFNHDARVGNSGEIEPEMTAGACRAVTACGFHNSVPAPPKVELQPVAASHVKDRDRIIFGESVSVIEWRVPQKIGGGQIGAVSKNA